MVETGGETERVIEGSGIGLCIDTGHLVVGGADPVAITAAHPERVVHVHLKDVDAALAKQVIDGMISFGAAVKAGIFRPLGQGDVDIAAMVRALEQAGYQGWYVLEQDVMLDDRPEGEGPVGNVRESLDFLRGVGS
jgi:inosose dehydratase